MVGVVGRLVLVVVGLQNLLLRCRTLMDRRSRVPLGPLHLQVRPHAMVAQLAVAEVDDAAFVRALVRRLHAGQTELVGDVASGNLHHLRRNGQENWSGDVRK